MASTLAEAGASAFNSAYFPPAVRHATTTRKTLLHDRRGLFCLTQQPSETVSRNQRDHA
jgi:hypothetical protein